MAAALTSCRTSDELVYISDAQYDSATTILQEYSTIVMPGDELAIDIVSMSPESLFQFYKRSGGNSSNNDVRNLRSEYLVSQEGTIEMPMLGKMTVAGLPLDTVATNIQKGLIDSNFVEDPTVTVTRTNFRITVLGEVRKPQQFTVDGNRITILEAIAVVGDIKQTGMRDCVKVMREQNGEQQIGIIDLTSQEIFNSPYYYLQQNDIVYVEPNDKRKRTATYNPNILSYISIGASIVNLITSLGLRMERVDRYLP